MQLPRNNLVIIHNQTYMLSIWLFYTFLVKSDVVIKQYESLNLVSSSQTPWITFYIGGTAMFSFQIRIIPLRDLVYFIIYKETLITKIRNTTLWNYLLSMCAVIVFVKLDKYSVLTYAITGVHGELQSLLIRIFPRKFEWSWRMWHISWKKNLLSLRKHICRTVCGGINKDLPFTNDLIKLW